MLCYEVFSTEGCVASNAAAKALAIASLLLPGLAASPITVTICPGLASEVRSAAVGFRARY